LKDDLADALKENLKLQAELAEVYGQDPVGEAAILQQREQEREADKFKQEIQQSSLTIAKLTSELHAERKYYSASGLDLIKALAIVEIIALNGPRCWEYFSLPKGREEIEWAHKRYQTEMEKIFKDYGRPTS
jgi:hypothetical protein